VAVIIHPDRPPVSQEDESGNPGCLTLMVAVFFLRKKRFIRVSRGRRGSAWKMSAGEQWWQSPLRSRPRFIEGGL